MHLLVVPGNLYTDNSSIIMDYPKGTLQYFARALIAFLVKVISSFKIIPSGPKRTSVNVHASDAFSLVPDHSSTMEAAQEATVSSFSERLEKLESKLDELSSKSAEIPQEKEIAILESMNRIKCIESDLHKTNKVGFLFENIYTLHWPEQKLNLKNHIKKPDVFKLLYLF